jgi:hypothetical protein
LGQTLAGPAAQRIGGEYTRIRDQRRFARDRGFLSGREAASWSAPLAADFGRVRGNERRPAASGRAEPGLVSLCYGRATSKGITMNRNVTIGLGTLIIIIIIVALVF